METFCTIRTHTRIQRMFCFSSCQNNATTTSSVDVSKKRSHLVIPKTIVFWSVTFIFVLILKQCEGNLQDFLNTVEVEINSLAQKTWSLHANVCSKASCASVFQKNSFACTSNSINQGEGSYCSSDQGTAYYTSEPGCLQCSDRYLNRGESVIRTASREFTCKDNVLADICWTKDLEQDFKTTRLSGLLWQQIATRNGFTRIYPGSAQEECYSYDPRLRSWFVAASTGPKDVVILIDSSSSMSLVPSTRSNVSLMQLAIQAVSHVLSTLTYVDYVAVAQFSTVADQVAVNEVYTLIQATRKNITALTAEVSKIQHGGHTNFEEAFKLAFHLFERSASIGRTTGCSKAILFMTDGSPTRGEDNPTRLAKIVEDLNTRPDGSKIANIFTYSISNVAEKEISKHIACSANGIWSEVETGTAASLQEQISQYYEYYSTLHKGSSGIIWTEPYLDVFGADMVVTAAKAVYTNSDTNQSSLVAVVAADISYEYLQTLGSSRATIIAELQQRQTFCPVTAVYSQCELEVLRQKVYSDGSINYKRSPEKTCNQSLICQLPDETACPNRTFQYEKCTEHITTSQDYLDVACCGMFLPCSTSNIPSVSRLSTILSAAISFLLATIAACPL